MKNQEMKELVFELFADYYRTCHCDRYGQIKTIDVYCLFKNNTKECLEYLKENPLVQISNYGDRYGSYLGINPWGCFNDKDLEQICKDSFKKNVSRNNMNNW